VKDRRDAQHQARAGAGPQDARPARKIPRLEVVVKADTAGTLDAVCKAIGDVRAGEVAPAVIHRDVGPVSKSDLSMAVTGSRLVLGFGVGLAPRVEETARRDGVEIRLYDVIYDLTADLTEIVRSLLPEEAGEEVLGEAEVIALFKSSRKGIILGCRVLRGQLALGDRFRLIEAAGPVYHGVIESLHIGRDAVAKAAVGREVGLKIRDFKKAGIGDLVESYRPRRREGPGPWTPAGGVRRSPR